MIIIGDTHGCYKTLVALIAQLPPEEPLCFVGDLIDRGRGSLDVIELIRMQKYHCVRGNHEQLMLDAIVHGARDAWAMNGGNTTLANYAVNKSLLQDHITWISKLPYYIDFTDIKNDKGENLFVSHAGLPYKNMQQAIDSGDIMWHRNSQYVPDNRYSVFGHTPKKDPLIQKHYANVDTGCVYGNYLTALQFPSMKIWKQDNVE